MPFRSPGKMSVQETSLMQAESYESQPPTCSLLTGELVVNAPERHYLHHFSLPEQETLYQPWKPFAAVLLSIAEMKNLLDALPTKR